jgi:hypothetical protein
LGPLITAAAVSLLSERWLGVIQANAVGLLSQV